VTGSLRYNGG
jgi:hypothetical protein